MGRMLSGSAHLRSTVQLSHRIQAAWAKFHIHRHIFVDKAVSVYARLKLFQSVTSPTILFGLSEIPLMRSQVKQLDTLQRRMLRRVVGWIRSPAESWSDTMRRMNTRLEHALPVFPMEPWSVQLARQQFRLAHRVAQASDGWPARIIKWCPWETNPQAGRGRGRPKLRWDDCLSSVTADIFGSRNWLHVFEHLPRSQIQEYEDKYVFFFAST